MTFEEACRMHPLERAAFTLTSAELHGKRVDWERLEIIPEKTGA